MENKLIFKNKELAYWDSTVLGISGENEQEMLIFGFEDGFVDGMCYLELEFPNGKKGWLELDKEGEGYILEVKNSLLKYEGVVRMQLKIVQVTAVWKSHTFEMHVLEAINAAETMEEDYPCFVDRTKIRIEELEKGMRQLDEKILEGVPDFVKGITKEDVERWNGKSDFSGNYEDLENKPQIPDVSGFIDKTVDNLINYDTREQVNEKIAKIRTMKLERVEVLPTENISTDTIYLVLKENAESDNIYDQFVFFDDAWERWGDTEIDLSKYATMEALRQALSDIDLSGYTTKEYVDGKIGDIDILLLNIADESEVI